MMRRILPIFVLLILLTQTVRAQDLFTGSLASTREMLLYRKAAGPYLLTVQGERFIDKAYVEIDIFYGTQQVSPETVVTVRAEPQRVSDVGAHNAEETAQGKGRAATFTAEYRDGKFVVAPLSLDATGLWLLTVSVDGEQGEGATAFQVRVYPRKPDAPIMFNLTNIGVPVVTLIALLGFVRWRRIPLMQKS